MLGLTVTATLADWEMFHHGGSASNGATPSSLKQCCKLYHTNRDAALPPHIQKKLTMKKISIGATICTHSEFQFHPYAVLKSSTRETLNLSTDADRYFCFRWPQKRG